MAICEILADGFRRVEETSFCAAGIRARADLQRLLRTNLEVISPETLVISEEFGEWQESRRRIDLLGIDKDANLVVIELKRSEDGEHMELQAIRYAAMVSTMTFERAVEVYAEYSGRIGSDLDPLSSILVSRRRRSRPRCPGEGTACFEVPTEPWIPRPLCSV